MCERCKEFDDKIVHYRRIEIYITDKLTLEALHHLIGQAIAGKAALHPEEK